ncbi:hypothetical protein, partial [Klebsiella pneumoniae]|uniref:hypothetical protein n=1 Tax=Klebsiella pneumoniae TaxID=573 RepID=UPI00273057AD
EDYRDGVASSFNPNRGIYTEHEDPKTGLPDLTLRYQNQAAGLHYSASAMARQLEVEEVNGVDDSATGYGLNLAARYPA